jgi:hypothetical protein
MIVFLQAPLAVLAQENSLGCLAPKAPDVALSAEVLALYRQEITIEFEHYFGAVSAYIACLDTERAAALEEARKATDAYERFLDMVPNDENR